MSLACIQINKARTLFYPFLLPYNAYIGRAYVCVCTCARVGGGGRGAVHLTSATSFTAPHPWSGKHELVLGRVPGARSHGERGWDGGAATPVVPLACTCAPSAARASELRVRHCLVSSSGDSERTHIRRRTPAPAPRLPALKTTKNITGKATHEQRYYGKIS